MQSPNSSQKQSNDVLPYFVWQVAAHYVPSWLNHRLVAAGCSIIYKANSSHNDGQTFPFGTGKQQRGTREVISAANYSCLF